ncbi:hypothetical protein IW140_005742 [Coemansia sp. RSA 1813]|nr:hypothetical protein EV178_005796 [Coemansia sp. RSA 1646]KAJ1767989.1 hypothetical protein LPJ74_005079 [Coemansia sp. RSA 1843]KAJ2086425.1 hypothetical protein IW138_005709 [Coemansia sp. RSA 986]KAJ2211237.1 hypothetical protein EV179_005648 [Coemansia sp. RSA 487]KAJ2564479.1 hypothetical protein IW140_005742 [Coemansia sp. RSA 1813]
MSKKAGKNTKSNEGCSVFRIPPDVLSNLQLSSKLNRVYPQTPEPAVAIAASASLAQSLSDTRIARPVCHTCGGVEFPDADQQREHSKTAWHRENMLRKTEWRRRNLDHTENPEEYPWEPIPEKSTAKTDAAAATANVSNNNNEESDESDKGKESSPYMWFSADDAGALATVYGVQRKILAASDSDRSVYIDADRVLRQLVDMQASNSSSHWVIMSLNGGHFGAAVFDNRTGDIVAHKTLHRYTTRRKQGGSQSREDNAKGRAANSAGAQIRRYNEQKLMEEIHDIVQQWQNLLKRSTRIFVRVPRANRKSFPLDWSDERIRSVPVPIARPTLVELRRIYSKITTVKIRTVELCKPDDLQEQQQLLPELSSDDEAESESEENTLEPVPDPELLAFLHDVAAMILDGSVSSETIIQHLREHLAELLDALSDPALGLRYLETTDTIKAHRTPTLLHLASSLGRESLISFLLDNGDDPTITNGHPPAFSGGKTAYEMAKDRKTRDEFRVYRFDHDGEEYDIDWKLARVSDPISREKLEEREEKVREKSKNYRKQRKAKKTTNPAEGKKPGQETKPVESSKLKKQTTPSAFDPSSFSVEEQKAIDRELRLQALDRRAVEDKKAHERELRLQAVERRRLQELQNKYLNVD